MKKPNGDMYQALFIKKGLSSQGNYYLIEPIASPTRLNKY